MKIEYKILWLDDRIQEFIEDELIDDLNEYIEEKGFSPEIITAHKQEDFLSKLDDSFDLILTDYHMDDVDVDGEAFNGDLIVAKIRERSILTEILFYTAKADLKDTQKISRVSFLETSNKQGDHTTVLLNETKELIDLTIKKFEHVVAMRGMIMHETSTLDYEMLQILNTFINDPNNSVVVQEFGTEILQEVEELFASKLAAIQKLIPTSNLKKLSRDNFVFSAAYKVKTMGKILQTFQMEDFSEEYSANINKMRNTFAHAVLQVDSGTGRKSFKNGEITFDEDLCKKIRRDIIKSKSDLNILAEKLND